MPPSTKRGRLAVLVDIDLRNLESAFQFPRDSRNCGAIAFAGPAPRCPEVHENGSGTRGQELVEVGIDQVDFRDIHRSKRSPPDPRPPSLPPIPSTRRCRQGPINQLDFLSLLVSDQGGSVLELPIVCAESSTLESIQSAGAGTRCVDRCGGPPQVGCLGGGISVNATITRCGDSRTSR